VAPVLVRVVAASPPNDLPRPITIGPQTRFSRDSFSALGAASERELKQVANKARTASLSTLRMEDFMVTDCLGLVLKLGYVGMGVNCCDRKGVEKAAVLLGWKSKGSDDEELMYSFERGIQPLYLFLFSNTFSSYFDGDRPDPDNKDCMPE
jgi:hypothetical protein